MAAASSAAARVSPGTRETTRSNATPHCPGAPVMALRRRYHHNGPAARPLIIRGANANTIGQRPPRAQHPGVLSLSPTHGLRTPARPPHPHHAGQRAIREIPVASSPGMPAGGLPAAESFPSEIMEELTGAVRGIWRPGAPVRRQREGFLPCARRLSPTSPPAACRPPPRHHHLIQWLLASSTARSHLPRRCGCRSTDLPRRTSRPSTLRRAPLRLSSKPTAMALSPSP